MLLPHPTPPYERGPAGKFHQIVEMLFVFIIYIDRGKGQRGVCLKAPARQLRSERYRQIRFAEVYMSECRLRVSSV